MSSWELRQLRDRQLRSSVITGHRCAPQPHPQSQSQSQSQSPLCPISLGSQEYQYPIGFAPQSIRKGLTHTCSVAHDGCINTLKWSLDGNTLVSGSDDQTVKLWRFNSDSDLTLQHSLETAHSNNIFCAELSPHNENWCLSAGADGKIIKSDLSGGHGQAQEILFSSSSFVHTFSFDAEHPQILYTAEDAGMIHRIDLRSRHVDCIFDTAGNEPQTLWYIPKTSIKAICQSSAFGSQYLFVGGGGLMVHMHDIRKGDAMQGSLSPSLKRFAPPFRNPHMQGADESELGVFQPVLTKFVKRDGFMSLCAKGCSANVSGMDFSKDGSEIVVSYQNDQIYTFSTKLHPNWVEEGPTKAFGGHLNHFTFLKTVKYFSPRDDYIVSGSDSGHLWVWDARCGSTDITDNDQHTANVVAFIKADLHTCNGAAPHPTLPIIATYGIEQTAKIWAYRDPEAPPTADGKKAKWAKLSTKTAPTDPTCPSYHARKRSSCVSNTSDCDSCYHDEMHLLPHVLEANKIVMSASVKGSSVRSPHRPILDSHLFDRHVYAIRKTAKLFEFSASYQAMDVTPDFPSDFIYGFTAMTTRYFIPKILEVLRLVDLPVSFDAEGLRDHFDPRLIEQLDRGVERSLEAIYLSKPSTPYDFDDAQDPDRYIKCHLLFDAVSTEADSVGSFASLVWRSVLGFGVYSAAAAVRQAGNAAFKNKDYLDAAHLYAKAIRYLSFLYASSDHLIPPVRILRVNRKKYVEAFSRTQGLPISDDLKIDVPSSESRVAPMSRYCEDEHYFQYPNIPASKRTKYVEDLKKDSTPLLIGRNIVCLTEWVNRNMECDQLGGVAAVMDPWLNRALVIYKYLGIHAPLAMGACWSNLVACYLQIEDYAAALHESQNASDIRLTLGLEVDPKICYRRGLAFMGLKDYSNAIKELQEAAKLSPTDAAIVKKIKEAKQAVETVKKAEAAKYQKIFASSMS